MPPTVPQRGTAPSRLRPAGLDSVGQATTWVSLRMDKALGNLTDPLGIV